MLLWFLPLFLILIMIGLPVVFALLAAPFGLLVLDDQARWSLNITHYALVDRNNVEQINNAGVPECQLKWFSLQAILNGEETLAFVLGFFVLMMQITEYSPTEL